MSFDKEAAPKTRKKGQASAALEKSVREISDCYTISAK